MADLGKGAQTPYFLTKLQPKGPKTFFGDHPPSYLRVWMTGSPTTPVSEGLDPPLKQEFYVINSGTNIPLFCSREFLKAVIKGGFPMRTRETYLKFTCVNDIGTMYGRPRVQMSGFTFYIYARPSIHCLYFIYSRKT